MAKRHRTSAVEQSRFMELNEVQQALEEVSNPTAAESAKTAPEKEATPKKKPSARKTRKKREPKATGSDQLFSLTDAKAIKEEEQLTHKGRKKYTTMIRPELKELLQRIAKNKGLTIPDVVEGVLLDYFNMTEEELSRFSTNK